MKSFTFHSLMKCKGSLYQKTVRAAQTVPVPQKEEEIPITSDFFLFHFLYDSLVQKERGNLSTSVVSSLFLYPPGIRITSTLETCVFYSVFNLDNPM